jgi:hypothetical protein
MAKCANHTILSQGDKPRSLGPGRHAINGPTMSPLFTSAKQPPATPRATSRWHSATSRVAVSTLLAISPWLGCKQDEGSRLRDRSQPMPNERTVSEVIDPSPGADAPAPVSDEAPAEPTEFVALRLAMPQDQTYSVTTVAMVELPLVNQPMGWAREERFSFEDCTGDGMERACTIRHDYTAFEGQPPAGPLLEADELKIRDVTSRHSITATGYREGPTQLQTDDRELDPGLAESLATIHRLYCIRFPKEPIGVGAKWNDSCQTFDRGVAVTRNLLWELSELRDDAEVGKRAELRGIGEYVVPGPKGDRKGTVEMILYFFVDHGEPHLLRERRSVPVSEQRGAHTKETVSIQFSKVLQGDPARTVRTDGRPFPTGAHTDDQTDDQTAGPEASASTPNER